MSTNKEIEKINDVISNHKISCRCGHSISPFTRKTKGKILCTYCGNYVKTEKEKFVDSVLLLIKEKNKGEKNVK